jgi:hypothetical protein
MHEALIHRWPNVRLPTISGSTRSLVGRRYLSPMVHFGGTAVGEVVDPLGDVRVAEPISVGYAMRSVCAQAQMSSELW